MPPLGRWLSDFGIPSLLSIFVTFFVMRFLFREDLRRSIDCEVEDSRLSGNGKLVLAGLSLMIAVLLTCLCTEKRTWAFRLALLPWQFTAIVSIKAKSNPAQACSRD